MYDFKSWAKLTDSKAIRPRSPAPSQHLHKIACAERYQSTGSLRANETCAPERTIRKSGSHRIVRQVSNISLKAMKPVYTCAYNSNVEEWLGHNLSVAHVRFA